MILTAIQPDMKTVPEKTMAFVLVEAKPGEGKIILPGLKPILLSEYQQDESVTINEHVVIHARQTVRIGRDASNELVLDIPNVSRFHALFAATSSTVRLSDLSSTNGTFVNGKPVTAPVKLESGDVIGIGSAKLKVELLSELRTQTDMRTVGTLCDPVTTSGLVTVLVADVCDYTKLSEVLPPKELTNMLQLWFEQVSKIINEFGGKVDKYIGDCVMAFWQCTDQNAKIIAIDATKAAVKIKKETQRLSASPSWLHRDSYSWDCRVSLNTGQVMIGKVGGRGQRDFTILGDVVNVAFRLNTVAGNRGYDFVMGDATANHAKDTVKLTKLGPVQVKGRRQKVIAFTLA